MSHLTPSTCALHGQCPVSLSQTFKLFDVPMSRHWHSEKHSFSVNRNWRELTPTSSKHLQNSCIEGRIRHYAAHDESLYKLPESVKAIPVGMEMIITSTLANETVYSSCFDWHFDSSVVQSVESTTRYYMLSYFVIFYGYLGLVRLRLASSAKSRLYEKHTLSGTL